MNKVILCIIIVIIMLGTSLGYNYYNQFTKNEMHESLKMVTSDLLNGITTSDYFDNELPDLNYIKNANRIIMHSNIVNRDDISDGRVVFYEFNNEYKNMISSPNFDFKNKDAYLVIMFNSQEMNVTLDYAFGNLGGQFMSFKVVKSKGKINFKLISHEAA